MPYETAIQSWHDFYIVAGTAAATLVGLLFVGLSLHLRVVVTRSDVRSLGRVTLANYALVLFVALITIIPQRRDGASVQIIGAGIFTAVVSIRSLIGAIRTAERTLRLRQLMLRFGLSELSYAGIITAGALLAAGTYDAAVTWLATLTIVLLVLSLRNSWDLLVTVATATHEHPTA